MKHWKKEMISTIMYGSGDIHEILAALITHTYMDDNVYLDNLASKIAENDIAKTEELKEYLDDEVINHKEL